MGFQSQREVMPGLGSHSYLVSEVNEGLPALKACTFFTPLWNLGIQYPLNQLHQHLGGERKDAVSFLQKQALGTF